jgi:hypothetical protein
MKRSFVVFGVIALMLVVATGAIAAHKFLITSSAQVKPGVLTGVNIKNGSLGATEFSAAAKAALRGAQGPAGSQGLVGPAGPAGVAGPRGLTGSTGSQGPQGAIGPQGVQGAVGAGLKILGSFAAPADLPAVATATVGDAYLIAGELWVWTGAPATAFTNAGPVKGPTGAQGVIGPQGIQGAQGVAGPQGTAGTAAVSIHTAAFTLQPTGQANSAAVVTASCVGAQKAVGGGYESTGNVFNEDTFPTAADDGWSIFLFNADAVVRTGTVDVTCLGA